MKRIAYVCTVVAVIGGACWAEDEPQPSQDASAAQPEAEMMGDSTMAITITSTAFAEGGTIPKMYTCDSVNVSPPLAWKGIPDSAKSLALICDDPDALARTWVHWVIYGIPPDTNMLSEGVPKDSLLPNGAVQGMTDFKRTGYGGPCPPSGTHRYFFTLYALDFKPEFKTPPTKDALVKVMAGHVLAEGLLMGRYKRGR